MRETDSIGAPLSGAGRYIDGPTLPQASIRGLLKREILRAPDTSASFGHRICLHASNAYSGGLGATAQAQDAVPAVPGRQITLTAR